MVLVLNRKYSRACLAVLLLVAVVDTVVASNPRRSFLYPTLSFVASGGKTNHKHNNKGNDGEEQTKHLTEEER